MVFHFLILFFPIQQMGCFDSDDQTELDPFSGRNLRKWYGAAAAATHQRVDSIVGLL